MQCAMIVLRFDEFFVQMCVNSACRQHCLQKFGIYIRFVLVRLCKLHWLYLPDSAVGRLVRAFFPPVIQYFLYFILVCLLICIIS